jgi:predicted amidohydrolase YtcJ
MDTYMGDKFTTIEQRIEHFTWCWDSNINDFKESGVIFRNTEDLYIYFKQFMIDSFYTATDKGDINVVKQKLMNLWGYILSFNTNKTRSDVDMFLDVYKIFEKTLQK